MFGKKKILPKQFQSLLEAGDLAALQQVYDTCEINARNGREGSNAFEMIPLPRDFAFWLKEQGGDVNLPSRYGRTPIFQHAASPDGDVDLLLELGANPSPAAPEDGTTPLHLAAASGRLEAMEALIAHGADVHALRNDLFLGAWGITPLELSLLQAKLPFSAMVAVCELLMSHGAQTTKLAKKAVSELGERFELEKGEIDDIDLLASEEASLQRLREII